MRVIHDHGEGLSHLYPFEPARNVRHPLQSPHHDLRRETFMQSDADGRQHIIDVVLAYQPADDIKATGGSHSLKPRSFHGQADLLSSDIGNKEPVFAIRSFPIA